MQTKLNTFRKFREWPALNMWMAYPNNLVRNDTILFECGRESIIRWNPARKNGSMCICWHCCTLFGFHNYHRWPVVASESHNCEAEVAARRCWYDRSQVMCYSNHTNWHCAHGNLMHCYTRRDMLAISFMGWHRNLYSWNTCAADTWTMDGAHSYIFMNSDHVKRKWHSVDVDMWRGRNWCEPTSYYYLS